jgi:hypothetical protein
VKALRKSRRVRRRSSALCSRNVDSFIFSLGFVQLKLQRIPVQLQITNLCR